MSTVRRTPSPAAIIPPVVPASQWIAALCDDVEHAQGGMLQAMHRVGIDLTPYAHQVETALETAFRTTKGKARTTLFAQCAPIARHSPAYRKALLTHLQSKRPTAAVVLAGIQIADLVSLPDARLIGQVAAEHIWKDTQSVAHWVPQRPSVDRPSGAAMRESLQGELGRRVQQTSRKVIDCGALAWFVLTAETSPAAVTRVLTTLDACPSDPRHPLMQWLLEPTTTPAFIQWFQCVAQGSPAGRTQVIQWGASGLASPHAVLATMAALVLAECAD